MTKREIRKLLRGAADRLVYHSPERFDDEAHEKAWDTFVSSLYQAVNKLENEEVKP